MDLRKRVILLAQYLQLMLKTLTGRAIPDVGRGLQGAAAGLSVTIPSGEVGSDRS
jgi:hypothetical protein